MTFDILNILLYLAMAAVVATLVFGLFTLARDGNEARSRSNKLMRLRVLLQFIAILLIIVVVYLKNQMGS